MTEKRQEEKVYTLRLTKHQARILLSLLWGKQEGFTVAQMRQVSQVDRVFREKIGAYDQRMDDLLAEYQKLIVDAADERLAQRIAYQRDERTNSMVDGEGKQVVNIDLGEADFAVVKERWGAVDKLTGHRTVAMSIIAIDDAISRAMDSTEKDIPKRKDVS